MGRHKSGERDNKVAIGSKLIIKLYLCEIPDGDKHMGIKYGFMSAVIILKTKLI